MKSWIVLLAAAMFFTLTSLAQNERISLTVSGMSTAESSLLIHEALSNKYGIVKDELNYDDNTAVVEYDTDKINIKEILQTIEDSGYEASVKLHTDFSLPVKQERIDSDQEMSKCKSDCAKECCTNPNLNTGKCTCSDKGVDCSLQCCGPQLDKE